MMLIPGRNYGRNLFDDFFNDSFFNGSSASEKADESRKMSVMRTDIREKEGNYLLDIELPGYKKEDIQAELKEGYLTISAQAPAQETASAQEKFLHRERYTGSCKRTFYVGELLRQEDIHAAFENGVLTLQIPKEAPKVEETPKYINIL